MIATINSWVSKVVGTVKAPLGVIAPEIVTKKTVKAKTGKAKKAKKSKRK